MMIVLALPNGLGISGSLCDEASALRRPPELVLLIWLFSDGIGVPLESACGMDLHRTKYQPCARAGSTAAEGDAGTTWCMVLQNTVSLFIHVLIPSKSLRLWLSGSLILLTLSSWFNDNISICSPLLSFMDLARCHHAIRSLSLMRKWSLWWF